MKNYIIKLTMVLLLISCTLIFIFSLFMKYASADYVLDEKINRFCMEHKEANDSYFKEIHGIRCSLILQAQIRFETKDCTIGSADKNNCFGFRRNGFLSFENKTDSIIFAVNRYYKYEKYKTISQIIKGGYYQSPETGQTYYLNGYTLTEEHQQSYYTFVKNYFHNN